MERTQEIIHYIKKIVRHREAPGLGNVECEQQISGGRSKINSVAAMGHDDESTMRMMPPFYYGEA